MLRFKFIVFLLLGVSFNSFSQNKRIPLAIGAKTPIAAGIYFERNNSFYTGYQFDRGVMADYTTERNRIGVDLVYGLSKRLKTESTLGVSTYVSSISIGKLYNPFTNRITINTANLFVSQKIRYDVLAVPCFDFLKFTLSPFVGVEYEQFLPKREQKGHSDLFSDDANYDIDVLDIPAVSGETKIPAGILSAVGGLSLEILCFNKISVIWNAGYSYSLLGQSEINIKYRYQDNKINTLDFKSEKNGIPWNVKFRYYF